MAHEIKNPLTPIRLSAQRLEAKAATGSDDLPEVLDKTIRVINEEVNNLQNLVNAFSGFAKMPEARPEIYNLNEQLQEISEQYSDNTDLTLKLDDSLNSIYADPMQIKQVLVNLVQNAIQASPDGAPLAISTEVIGQRCHIRVIDSGPGITPEDLTKIFEPYFTTKKKGTGLGLAISRRIIQQHGGDIRVESRVGEGSTFEIWLPCRLEPQETADNQNKETD
jgi:signal transduction histidine kinase